ncbi:MAG: ABC transporter permease [Spirochaetes bacterium]|nr:ABC transporter permease [Spirochaetota bacterium]MBU1081568.1 ABC transporter permease [Spirochaetota bacterium]
MRNPGLLIIGRALKRLVSNPAPLLSGLGMSAFFLVVYDAAIGGIGFLPEFGGAGYMAFLLPMGVVSLLFASSSGSAQALSADIASGYFQRLALAPVPRSAFVLAAILADAIGVFASSLAVLGLGALLGAPLSGGLTGVLGTAALATLFGGGVSAASAATVMRSGKVELAGTIGSAVFMLLFLAPTFVPRELMGARWLQVVSAWNPLSYLMEAMRFLVSGLGEAASVPAAFAIAGAAGLGGTALAAVSVRKVLN